MEITIFELSGCPYCADERKAINELIAKHPEYSDIKITRIKEDEHPKIAQEYDYYYVPSIYKDGMKLMEASPSWKYQDMLHHIDQVFMDLISAS